MMVFVVLLSPCVVFLQKLILAGFLTLFEGYHENLHHSSATFNSFGDGLEPELWPVKGLG